MAKKVRLYVLACEYYDCNPLVCVYGMYVNESKQKQVSRPACVDSPCPRPWGPGVQVKMDS